MVCIGLMRYIDSVNDETMFETRQAGSFNYGGQTYNGYANTCYISH